MNNIRRRILVTGAKGFIGKNLVFRLRELSDTSVVEFVRGDEALSLPHLIAQVDAVIHLAGENRPVDLGAFEEVNRGLTAVLCNAIQHEYRTHRRHVPLVFASSAQAEVDNPYGRSKLGAEEEVINLAQSIDNPCAIFRLPGVFGKWCKPNYNSVVATFCNNISSNLPIKIDNPSACLRLVYVDDVVTAFLSVLDTPLSGCIKCSVAPEYSVRVGELADQIMAFNESRATLITQRVGSGFVRALYSTYVSYLPKESFCYDLPHYVDRRGVFVEMLKTLDSGQFSCFTAHPGITRGGHYHHSKTEKFLVIRGEARFRFRHLLTEEFWEVRTCGTKPQVVDTIPGWSHDITNVGDDEMVVILWANEIFDRLKSDTIASRV